jgi:hypothetical protein
MTEKNIYAQPRDDGMDSSAVELADINTRER